MNKQITKALTIAATAGLLVFPIAANAAVPGVSQMHGRITALKSKYDIHVENRKGEIDDVTLHPGTIINPTGLSLRPGMRVTILGNPSGQSFRADEIDTPYHIDDYAPAGPYWGGPFLGGAYFGSPFGPGFGWF